MARKKSPNVGTKAKAVEILSDPKRDALENYRNWLVSFHEVTEEFRLNGDMCQDFVNGKQWRKEDLEYARTRKRPTLTVNHLATQVNLVSGMQRTNRNIMAPIPREPNDTRTGEVSRACLVAAMDFVKYPRVASRAFVDGIVTGLGLMEVLYTLEDADDLFWGDIVISRINSLSAIWDPWNLSPDRFQKSRYVGKKEWMGKDEWEYTFPNIPFNSNDLGEHGVTADLDIPTSLRGELIDEKMNKTRVMTLWHKEPKRIKAVVNEETGQVIEVKNDGEAQKVKVQLSRSEGKEIADKLIVVDLDNEVMLGDEQGNMLVNLSTGEPLNFADRESADKALDELIKEVGRELIDQLIVIERKYMRPHWTRMTWGKILDEGESPYNHRKYPFAPFIAIQFSDDPESVRGILLDAIQPQEEFNKRLSQNLAITNTQTHSGWMNKKVGGADSKILSLLGSQPGVVIEYSNVKPEKIEPSPMSNAHQLLANEALANIRRVTGITDEASGLTTQKTVSGSAIRERKQGASLTLSPIFDNWAWTELEVAELILSCIQQFWPVEKIIRIVGIAEKNEPLGRDGTRIFNGMTTSEVESLVKEVKNIDFDLTFDQEAPTASEQQALFEKAVEVVALASGAGYQVGSKSMMELAKLSKLPSTMKEAFLVDLQQPPVMQDPSQVNASLQKTKDRFRGGRAGGVDNVS